MQAFLSVLVVCPYYSNALRSITPLFIEDTKDIIKVPTVPLIEDPTFVDIELLSDGHVFIITKSVMKKIFDLDLFKISVETFRFLGKPDLNVGDFALSVSSFVSLINATVLTNEGGSAIFRTVIAYISSVSFKDHFIFKTIDQFKELIASDAKQFFLHLPPSMKS